MFSEPLITVFAPQIVEADVTAAEQVSRFWSRPDGLIQLQHFQPSQSVSYQPHTHSEYNLVICVAGAVTKTQMGVTETIEPGEAFMGNFGVEHASSYHAGSKGCETVCVTVNRRILAELRAECSLLHTPYSPVFLGKISSPVLHACALEIGLELRRRDWAHDIVLEALVMRMLVETLRLWPRRCIERCQVDLTPRLSRRDFVRAYEFMRWCRKDLFRVSQLCRFLNASEERFTRLFRATTNDTPASFYNRILLEHGCDLLTQAGMTVKDVSSQLGFRNTNHFVSSFQRRFGMTPADYRDRAT